MAITDRFMVCVGIKIIQVGNKSSHGWCYVIDTQYWVLNGDLKSSVYTSKPKAEAARTFLYAVQLFSPSASAIVR